MNRPSLELQARVRILVAGVIGRALLPSAACAGMPSPLPGDVAKALRLTEDAAMRYQAISFFLLILCLSALVVRWLWNRLSADFPKLPRLSFVRSLAVVSVWGLLFLVVLTMIAGTRELMTPGVWEKQGLLYRVPPAAAESATDAQRMVNGQERGPADRRQNAAAEKQP